MTMPVHLMNSDVSRLVLVAAMLAAVGPARAGDAAAGREKARALCQACHGEDGRALIPGAANLSGQQKEYLVQQLRAFQSGARRNDQMSIVAKPLTGADIENLAEWYSSIPVTVSMPK
jgi:cytochrome c553